MSLMLDFHLSVKDKREGTHNQESHGRRYSKNGGSSGDSKETKKAIPEDKPFTVDDMEISRKPPKKGDYGRGIGKVLITPEGDAFWPERRHRALHQHVLGEMLGEENPKATSRLWEDPNIAYGWAYPDYATLTINGHSDEPPEAVKKRLRKLYPEVKYIKWSNAKDPNGVSDVDLKVKDLADQPGYYIDLSPAMLDFHLSVKDEREGDHNQASHRPKSSGRKERFAAQGFEDATPEDRKRLAIPPAWKDVQINRDPNARLMAVGEDAKGREQRIYSPKHHEEQAAAKFARIKALHDRMPKIDKRLSKDAKNNDDALAALMIRRMGLRPGSDADTGADKKAYGATNLKPEHVNVNGDDVNLKFTGKKGVDLDLSINDPELARLLKGRLKKKKPGDRLLDTNAPKLRAYLKDAAPGVKPKDFRTYLGTAAALDAVKSMPKPKNRKEYQSQRKRVGEIVSELLGNTPTVALASYIAPAVFGPWDKAVA